MILSVPHCLCWLFYFQNIITFLFEKLTCAVEILILSDAVDFLTMSMGMPYSVVTAQQACSTEMVKNKLWKFNKKYLGCVRACGQWLSCQTNIVVTKEHRQDRSQLRTLHLQHKSTIVPRFNSRSWWEMSVRLEHSWSRLIATTVRDIHDLAEWPTTFELRCHHYQLCMQ